VLPGRDEEAVEMSVRATEREARPSVVSYVVRGAIGGLLAGAVFIGVTMWFVTTLGNPAVAPLNLISSIVLGADALQSGAASVPVGVVVHVVLSLLFGAALGLVASRLPNDATIAVAGLVFGLGLYILNFQIIGRLVLPQFQMPNQPFEVFAHLTYGALTAPFVFHWSRRRETA
jgi:hypothetical protein